MRSRTVIHECAFIFAIARRTFHGQATLALAKRAAVCTQGGYLVRTFHREMDRCLLDEIGKPDREQAGSHLPGMKIEKRRPDVPEEETGREISVVSAPRGSVSRFFAPPPPPIFAKR